MSDVSPLSGISGLSFDYTMITLLHSVVLLPTLMALSVMFSLSIGLLLFLFCLFFPCLLAHSPVSFSRNIFNIFRKEVSFLVWLLIGS